jgi:hypothetical protein
MPTKQESLVRVHREWNGWRSAEVRLGDLQGVHWLQPKDAPAPLLHAYVQCTDIVSGDIPHDCDKPSLPHRLLVCVLKRHAIPTAYLDLAGQADAQRTGIEYRRPPLATAVRIA